MSAAIDEIRDAADRIWQRAYRAKGQDFPIRVHIPRQPGDDDALVFGAIDELERTRALLGTATSALEDLRPLAEAARAVEASFSKDEPLRLVAPGEDAANRIVALRAALLALAAPTPARAGTAVRT